MVKLRNINRDNRRIWCDYYPESEKEAGMVVVDLNTGDLLESKSTEFEQKLGTLAYARYAALKLNQIKWQDVLPEKASYVWY